MPMRWRTIFGRLFSRLAPRLRNQLIRIHAAAMLIAPNRNRKKSHRMVLVVNRRIANSVEQVLRHLALHSKCNGSQVRPDAHQFRAPHEMAGIGHTFAAEGCEDEQRKRHRIPVAHGFADPLVQFSIVAGQHRCHFLHRRAGQGGLSDKFPVLA